MFPPHALEWLRCPIDPKRETRLIDEETHLTCAQCKVKLRVRDGFPNLIAEDAELPEGCANRKQLPCLQRTQVP